MIMKEIREKQTQFVSVKECVKNIQKVKKYTLTIN